MILIMFFIAILLIVVAAFSIIGITVSAKIKSEREKMSVFECGFDLLSSLRLPFSLNFYFIIIVFLIFDVEMVLILPFVFNMKLLASFSTMVVLFLFFLILIIGFIYEWLSGMLNWLI